MYSLTIKDYLIDLKANIIKLKQITDFSKYHLLKFLSTHVEFLGKVLSCSDACFERDNNSKFCFYYALLKLKAFSNYTQFITIKEKINVGSIIGSSKSTATDNVNDIVNLLNNYVKKNVSLNFYSDFRCSFEHKQKPTKNIAYTSNTNKTIYYDNINKRYMLDADTFCNDFCDAIDEILNSNDVKIKNYLNTIFLYY